MSRRNKLLKFAHLAQMKHVYENARFEAPRLTNAGKDDVDMCGRWASEHFENNRPIILELACGRGEYSVAMAALYPELNFIGVDIKGARIYKGARQAEERGLDNVAFLRTKIELIDHFFAANEVEGIWITFPDPFLKKSKSKKRLTSEFFLDKYGKILKPEGVIYLKTDSDELTAFTLDVIDKNGLTLHEYIADIYSMDEVPESLSIQTYYERMHLKAGKTIKFIKFSLS